MYKCSEEGLEVRRVCIWGGNQIGPRENYTITFWYYLTGNGNILLTQLKINFKIKGLKKITSEKQGHLGG